MEFYFGLITSSTTCFFCSGLTKPACFYIGSPWSHSNTFQQDIYSSSGLLGLSLIFDCIEELFESFNLWTFLMINKLPTSSSFSITICWCEQIQAPCLVTLQSYWACWLLQSDSLICGAAYCLWDLACIRLDHPDCQDSGEGQSGLGLERTTHIFKCSDHMIVFPIEIQTLSKKLVYSRLNSMRLKVQPAQIPNQGEKTFSSVPMGRKWPLSEIGQSWQEGVRNTLALLFEQLTDFLHVRKNHLRLWWRPDK